MLYVANPPRNKRLLEKFRLRFRMPYISFLLLSDDLGNHEIFSRYISEDRSRYNDIDFKLLVLGVLGYIGRSWVLDDVSEANGMSDDLNREFIYLFIKYGSTVLYKNG